MDMGLVSVGAPPQSSGRTVWQALTGRLVPAIVFGGLDLLVGRVVVNDFQVAVSRSLRLHEVVALAGATLYFVFVSLMIMLFLVRPPARGKDARLSSWLFAMLGTFGLTVAPLLPSGPALFRTGTGGALVESVVLVVALTLAVITLRTLGHAFSLTPQARTLVSSGPYRLVRHPLYLCEAMAMVCVTVGSGRSTLVIVAILVLAAQVRRAQLEERLLAQAFPDYQDVFRGVSHFLPGIF